ncbi:hypothetical protein ACICHK_40090 [Streptomyces sp. AHU1]|uniref:hypothetical protein n=1 Tax=Streptomyces sp. AHU1 TaxID=3377215 RepID=UPI0038781908
MNLMIGPGLDEGKQPAAPLSTALAPQQADPLPTFDKPKPEPQPTAVSHDGGNAD